MTEDTQPTAGPEPTGVVVGLFVALAGALFLLQGAIEWVAVGPLRIRPFGLSAAVFALGLSLGGVLFLARGRRLLGLAHAGTGVGWGVVVLATLAGSDLLFVVGAGVALGTAAFLAAEARN